MSINCNNFVSIFFGLDRELQCARVEEGAIEKKWTTHFGELVFDGSIQEIESVCEHRGKI